MGTTFRPYQPDQVLMLPPDLRGRSFSAPCERPGGRGGPERVLRTVPWGWASQLAVRSADDGQGADLCVCDGHVFVAEDGEEAGGGCRVSDAGGGELPEAPDAVVPQASWGFPGGAEVVLLARAVGLAGLGRWTKVRAIASKQAMAAGW